MKWVTVHLCPAYMSLTTVTKVTFDTYTYLNAEFQRIAKRDKKSSLSDQYEEIEENNSMEKIRSLQENQRYQGNISCKDGFNKEQKWYGPNRSRRY